MYRDNATYDTLKKLIIEIYIDYDLKKFPVKATEVCRKMGVELIPYSRFPLNEQMILLKYSEHGFFVNRTYENTPAIFYNDAFVSGEAQRFTIFHELKHYVSEDCNDECDDLADFFARYFMCPIPYLLLKDYNTPADISRDFEISTEAAHNVLSNLCNRKRKYGYRLFDYEIPLISHLEPKLLEISHETD